MRWALLFFSLLGFSQQGDCASKFWQTFESRMSAYDQTQKKHLLSLPGGPYELFLSEDLEQLYKKERSQIWKAWQQQPQSVQGDKALREKLRKKFFSERTQLLNERTAFRTLAQLHEAFSNSKAQSTNEKTLKKIWEKLDGHPVAGTTGVQAFDPMVSIGFCFSRALLAHHLLLEDSVANEHIFKLFAVGPMAYSGVFWRYHVASIVWTKNGFRPVDLLTESQISLKDWVKEITSLAQSKDFPQTRFYLARAFKFDASSGGYPANKFSNRYLKPFFDALEKNLSL